MFARSVLWTLLFQTKEFNLNQQPVVENKGLAFMQRLLNIACFIHTTNASQLTLKRSVLFSEN